MNSETFQKRIYFWKVFVINQNLCKLKNKPIKIKILNIKILFLFVFSLISNSIFAQNKEIKKAHDDVLLSVIYSSNGDELLTSDAGNILKIWNTETRKKATEIEMPTSYNWQIVLGKNASKIWSCSKEISLFDLKTKKQEKSFAHSNSDIYSIALSTDEHFIISANWDNTVKIWNTSTKELVQTLELHTKPVLSIAFHPFENKFLTSSSDKTIAVWNFENGQAVLQKQWQAHENDITKLIFSPDGNYFLSASGDETIKLWDSKTLDLQNTYKGHSAGVTTLAFSPKGDTFVSGGLDAKIIWWNTKTGFRIADLEGHEAFINAVAFSPKGTQIASADYNLVLRFWDLTQIDSTKNTKNLKYSQQLHRNYINQISISAKEDIFASVGKDSLLIIWGLKSALPIHTIRAHEQNISCVAISPNSELVATGSHDKTIKLWNTATGKLEKTLLKHNDWIQSVCFSPSGKKILSASWDKSLILWEVKSGKILQTIDNKSWVKEAGFLSEDTLFYATDDDFLIRIYDLALQKEIHQLSGHRNNITSISLSSDKKILASSANDSSLIIWNLEKFELESQLANETRYILDCEFLPDSRQIATVSTDGFLRFFDVNEQKMVKKIKLSDKSLSTLAIAYKEQLLISAGWDKFLNILEIK